MSRTFLDGKVTLFGGDSREVLKTLPEASVDSIVTDPPYGISFMSRAWDAPDGAPFAPEFWELALRVLKPGGHLVAFAGTRTYHRLATAVEASGFQIRDCIFYCYGAGFPKSHNLDGDWQGWGTALKPAVEPCVLARKPLIGTVAANVLEHGTGALNIDGCRIEAAEAWGAQGQLAGGDSVNDYGDGLNNSGRSGSHSLGRWPANLLLGIPADEYELRQDVTIEQKRELYGWLSENA
jgi:hypothetical protein